MRNNISDYRESLAAEFLKEAGLAKKIWEGATYPVRALWRSKAGMRDINKSVKAHKSTLVAAKALKDPRFRNAQKFTAGTKYVAMGAAGAYGGQKAVKKYKEVTDRPGSNRYYPTYVA